MAEKKVIYIEVEDDDFLTLNVIKSHYGLTWKDLLVYGAVKFVDAMGGQEKFLKEIEEKIKEMKKLEKQK